MDFGEVGDVLAHLGAETTVQTKQVESELGIPQDGINGIHVEIGRKYHSAA